MKKSTISWRKEDVTRKWYLINAEDVVLGRLSTKLANLLRGKGKTRYTPHIDCGDYVVVINADKVKLTGNKEENKYYLRYSGYPGGMKKRMITQVKKKNPEKVVLESVRRMLPASRLGRQVIKKLKIYSGSEYLEKAQKPEALVLSKYEG